jgi:hypothetical protein
MTTTATQPLLEGGNGHRRSTRSRSLLPVWNSDSEAGAPGFVEDQHCGPARLLLVEEQHRPIRALVVREATPPSKHSAFPPQSNFWTYRS